MFDIYPAKLDFLHLIESSVETLSFDGDFDLITCVHGLHYIGNKLAVIQKAAARLKTNGIFLANLDSANFKYADGTPAGKMIASEFRKSAIEYQSHRRLIICQGKKEINFRFEYLGADDKAGANYTKQPAVDSYYKQK
jgi:SAM-dependent methyltransferase